MSQQTLDYDTSSRRPTVLRICLAACTLAAALIVIGLLWADFQQVFRPEFPLATRLNFGMIAYLKVVRYDAPIPALVHTSYEVRWVGLCLTALCTLATVLTAALLTRRLLRRRPC